jgi:AcrR family transcriptional regulator
MLKLYSMNKTITRNEQKENRRQDILRAGLHLFIHKGYKAVKISDIAEKAGMSVGLLYHYFKSIEVLYEELITLALSGRTGQYFPQFSDPLDYFLKSAQHIFDMAKSDSFVAELFVLISQAQRNPHLPKDFKDKLAQNDVITKSISLIKKGQRQGIIRTGNPIALAMAFWLSIQSYVEMIALNPEMPFPEIEWFVDLLKIHE